MPHEAARCGTASNLRFHLSSPAVFRAPTRFRSAVSSSHRAQTPRRLLRPVVVRRGGGRQTPRGQAEERAPSGTAVDRSHTGPGQAADKPVPCPTVPWRAPPGIRSRRAPVEVLGPSDRTMERPGQRCTLPSATRAACPSCSATPGIRCSPPRSSFRAWPALTEGARIEAQPVSVGLTRLLICGCWGFIGNGDASMCRRDVEAAGEDLRDRLSGAVFGAVGHGDVWCEAPGLLWDLAENLPDRLPKGVSDGSHRPSGWLRVFLRGARRLPSTGSSGTCCWGVVACVRGRRSWWLRRGR